ILRSGTEQAVPAEGSPLARAAHLDDLGHQVLARLSAWATDDADVPAIKLVTPAEVGEALARLGRMLASFRDYQERLGQKPADAHARDAALESVVREDMDVARDAENARRASLRTARVGAAYLERWPGSALAQVLQRIRQTDQALHGPHADSFLTRHYHLAAKRIADLKRIARQRGDPAIMPGTGGGGIGYLAYARDALMPLFPALVATAGHETE
ncbi:MAG: hypothetical protein L0099_12755, partial [Acidobacteria bacterium]|nr:hypothetical protein [Acidobacteriota bacterium]